MFATLLSLAFRAADRSVATAFPQPMLWPLPSETETGANSPIRPATKSAAPTAMIKRRTVTIPPSHVASGTGIHSRWPQPLNRMRAGRGAWFRPAGVPIGDMPCEGSVRTVPCERNVDEIDPRDGHDARSEGVPSADLGCGGQGMDLRAVGRGQQPDPCRRFKLAGARFGHQALGRRVAAGDQRPDGRRKLHAR